MIEDDPELESTIEKRNSLIDEFETAQENGNQEKIDSIKTEFTEVSQKLQPVQKKLMQKEEFKSDAQEIETAVKNKMEEINPDTPDLITQLNELGSKLQQMQQQQNPKE